MKEVDEVTEISNDAVNKCYGLEKKPKFDTNIERKSHIRNVFPTRILKRPTRKTASIRNVAAEEMYQLIATLSSANRCPCTS